MIDYNRWKFLKNYAIAHEFDIYKGVWDYFTNIHPKTESQFNAQKFMAGGIPFYGSWMQSRSEDERNSHTRRQYSLNWASIQYPWLSGVTSGNTAQVVGSATWQFSKNIGRLYR